MINNYIKEKLVYADKKMMNYYYSFNRCWDIPKSILEYVKLRRKLLSYEI